MGLSDVLAILRQWRIGCCMAVDKHNRWSYFVFDIFYGPSDEIAGNIDREQGVR